MVLKAGLIGSVAEKQRKSTFVCKRFSVTKVSKSLSTILVASTTYCTYCS